VFRDGYLRRIIDCGQFLLMKIVDGVNLTMETLTLETDISALLFLLRIPGTGIREADTRDLRTILECQFCLQPVLGMHWADTLRACALTVCSCRGSGMAAPDRQVSAAHVEFNRLGVWRNLGLILTRCQMALCECHSLSWRVRRSKEVMSSSSWESTRDWTVLPELE
jgi:hypothetical protein